MAKRSHDAMSNECLNDYLNIVVDRIAAIEKDFNCHEAVMREQLDHYTRYKEQLSTALDGMYPTEYELKEFADNNRKLAKMSWIPCCSLCVHPRLRQRKAGRYKVCETEMNFLAHRANVLLIAVGKNCL